MVTAGRAVIWERGRTFRRWETAKGNCLLGGRSWVGGLQSILPQSPLLLMIYLSLPPSFLPDYKWFLTSWSTEPPSAVSPTIGNCISKPQTVSTNEPFLLELLLARNHGKQKNDQYSRPPTALFTQPVFVTARFHQPHCPTRKAVPTITALQVPSPKHLGTLLLVSIVLWKHAIPGCSGWRDGGSGLISGHPFVLLIIYLPHILRVIRLEV